MAVADRKEQIKSLRGKQSVAQLQSIVWHNAETRFLHAKNEMSHGTPAEKWQKAIEEWLESAKDVEQVAKLRPAIIGGISTEPFHRVQALSGRFFSKDDPFAGVAGDIVTAALKGTKALKSELASTLELKPGELAAVRSVLKSFAEVTAFDMTDWPIREIPKPPAKPTAAQKPAPTPLSTPAISAPDPLVTYEKIAGMVCLSKRTLEKRLKVNDLPPPFIKQSGRRPNQWKLSEVKPLLNARFKTVLDP